ncbi:DNA-directed RNA polymerase, subunit L [Archaeoglobus sulfaticallidus PM70-1]|uniref:DNA-directed RNA polymerase subunit Rpo11 n=1 Tax=Archaeoglobus sulfaticallidus PM70-1 TaxID=387631 RepID=N0BKM3_9EURY|nr:DNA-directed RNA polymerase subunit L [Archaeoglobus sulfaticallidus]AGK60760.1 DNA-directed RNA polymerase, subunit L [Archaeoglobus sulfaticallidus PM70-1]
MEVKIIEYEKDYIRLKIKGEDHTLLNLLQHNLLEDESVVIAKYDIPHPLIDEAELIVRTNGEDPIAVIKRVNERIIAECDEILGSLSS